jgi:hypothetical protein
MKLCKKERERGGWRLYYLLNSIKNADVGFDFRIALDDEQQPIAICWQSWTVNQSIQ